MCECTPPSLNSPRKCSCRCRPRSMACLNSGTSSSSLFATSASIFVMSIRTTRPAPIFICPTSLFPICPSGKPTAGPDVPISVFGNVRNNSSYTGFRASAIAFPSVSARYPHPSSTVNTIGFGRFVIAQKNTRPSRDLSHGLVSQCLFVPSIRKAAPVPADSAQSAALLHAFPAGQTIRLMLA